MLRQHSTDYISELKTKNGKSIFALPCWPGGGMGTARHCFWMVQIKLKQTYTVCPWKKLPTTLIT